MHVTLYIGALFVFTGQTFAQSPKSNITASTCASPGGYTSCYQTQASIFDNCLINNGVSPTAITACACVLGIGALACAISNCWNVVYGCEYQTLATYVSAYCFASEVPFYPAPDNAPGGCSCNLGDVFSGLSAVRTQYQTCFQSAGYDLAKLGACNCCVQSGYYTSKLSVCPNTDPSLDGFPGDEGLIPLLQPQFSQCGPTFNEYNCVQDLGFPSIGDHTYLSRLPASIGTQTLSTLAGTITSPVSGPTFTVNGAAGASVFTATFAATGSSGSSGSNSGSGSGSSPPSSSAVQANKASHWLVVVCACVSLVLFSC